MDTFLASSVGPLVMLLFQDLLTTRSWQTFTLLAGGWALASGRQTITAYLWVTGAATGKPFARFYVFRGCPFYNARWQVWARIVRHAAQLIPAATPLVVEFDATTQKKAGRQREGGARYRNGAGAARQAYRPLWGVNLVLGVRRVPLPRWPGQCVTVPIGVALYLQAAQAHTDNLPYRSRRALARQLVAFGAAELPGRPSQVLAAGGYATKAFLRDLPPSVDVIARLRISGKLSALPTEPPCPRRGRRPQRGTRLGSPKPLGRQRHGWQPHPTEAGAEVHAWIGLWHTVLPTRLVQVVVLRRPPALRPKKAGQRKPPPTVEAFFTTDLSLGWEDILPHYHDRGRGKSPCVRARPAMVSVRSRAAKASA